MASTFTTQTTGTPAKPRGATFEAGARRMMERLGTRSLESYYANTADPLHAAFEAKAIIHSGPGGKPLMGREAAEKLEALSGRRRTGKTLAYIHVPFCETRCLYCMFYQNPWKAGAGHAFAEALVKELALWSGRASQDASPVHAVYFGGGTPTALEPGDLRMVLSAVKKYLPLANDCEVTLEGRIHNFTDEKMEAALEGGVNRFSLGVQTFSSEIRQSMRRVDGREAILRRLEKLSSFDNASVVLDLIYGFPGQTPEVWEEDLQIATSLETLDGADCYQLNVFEKSPLSRFIENGKLPAAATTGEKADMFARSVEAFTDANWRRLSNNHWGRTARERNIYNALGKGPCDCLAFGCGAGGRLFGHSFMLERRLETWHERLAGGEKPVGFLMAPGPHWRLLRTISSQMESGSIHLGRIEAGFGLPILEMTAPVIAQWKEAGLVFERGGWLHQTVAGQFWHVTLAQLLIERVRSELERLEPAPSGSTDEVRHDFGSPAGTRLERLRASAT